MNSQTLKLHGLDWQSLRKYCIGVPLVILLTIVVTGVLAVVASGLNKIDTVINPAVVVDHDATQTLNTYFQPADSFPAGDDVFIEGVGERRRVCDVKYKRSLYFPNGTLVALRDGRGSRFTLTEGAVIVRIKTNVFWPKGRYRFESVGFHFCNQLLGPQVIKGMEVWFEIT